MANLSVGLLDVYSRDWWAIETDALFACRFAVGTLAIRVESAVLIAYSVPLVSRHRTLGDRPPSSTIPFPLSRYRSYVNVSRVIDTPLFEFPLGLRTTTIANTLSLGWWFGFCTTNCKTVSTPMCKDALYTVEQEDKIDKSFIKSLSDAYCSFPPEHVLISVLQ